LSDALLSCLDGFHDLLDLGPATVQVQNFFVQNLVHYVELQFLNCLDEAGAVVQGDWIQTTRWLVPYLDYLVVQLLRCLDQHLNVLKL
jgi:hypothetical protein